MPSKLEKIVTGGQTGADRAAWDAAIEAEIPTGGFVPAGRIAEDGRIPEHYPGTTETESPDPAERTRLNVVNSDATLLMTHGAPAAGSALTAATAREHDKPLLHIDFALVTREDGARQAAEWLCSNRVAILNVAGPRASEDPLIYDGVREFLREVFAIMRQ